MFGPLEADDLRIEPVPTETPGVLRLAWKGRSGARNPGKILNPYFEQVLTVVERESMPLEMHFEGLEHFNSSTLAVIIQLIQNARSRNVPLIFVYDDNLKWQRLSFDALRVFVKSDGLLQMRSNRR